VAEGVERPDQLAALRSLGCDLAQGYLFAPPRRDAELLSWLADRRDVRVTA
jgi:EAL domain-containing protein (putative c-di-GMP-specific phosphodiesterase class I)